MDAALFCAFLVWVVLVLGFGVFLPECGGFVDDENVGVFFVD